MKLNFKRSIQPVQYFSATVIALAMCLMAVAQAKFSTVVTEKQPSLSDYVQVEFTIENAKSVEKVSSPSFKNFRVIQGPIQANGMSYMNGAMSQYTSVSYILQPLVTGKLTIAGASAVIDGKVMQSAPVIIEVTNGPAHKSYHPSPGIAAFPHQEQQVDEEYLLQPGESIAEKIRKNLMVKTNVNKTTCYEGEPVMATFLLCSRLRSESKVLRRPSLNGFSVFDMVEPETNGPTVQAINGKPFNVHLIRKTQLFPLQSGTIVIEPVELDNTVKFVKTGTVPSGAGSPMQQMMDEFMNEGVRGTVEEHHFTLASKPVAITVRPLPAANRPAGFNGAVGKFTIKAEIKNNAIAAGDAVVMVVQIKGEGNFTVINPPAVALPESMEAYDPVIKENVDKSVYPLSGTKTFAYTFTPKAKGNYTIPGIVFSYFDPSDARYRTITTDSFRIHVKQQSLKKRFFSRTMRVNGSAPGAMQWISGIPVATVVLLLAVVFVAAFGLYQWKRSGKTAVTKPAAAPAAPAPVKTVAEALQQAKWAMQEGKSQQFYSEVNKAIWAMLSEQLHIPSTASNKYNVVAQLEGKGVDAAVTARLQAVMSECEIALYTPGHTATDMQQTLSKAEEVMKAVQLT